MISKIILVKIYKYTILIQILYLTIKTKIRRIKVITYMRSAHFIINYYPH